jgi:hypothetical protein
MDGIMNREIMERDTRNAAQTELARNVVVFGSISEVQVFNENWLAGFEDVLRNALAGPKAGAIQWPPLVVARATEAQLSILLLEHDEASLGRGQLNRCIHYQRKEVVQNGNRAESPESGEQLSNILKSAN